jgi:hypothetical protein
MLDLRRDMLLAGATGQWLAPRQQSSPWPRRSGKRERGGQRLPATRITSDAANMAEAPRTNAFAAIIRGG